MGERWVDLLDSVATGGLLDTSRAIRVVHSVCPSCKAALRRDLTAGPLGLPAGSPGH